MLISQPPRSGLHLLPRLILRATFTTAAAVASNIPPHHIPEQSAPLPPPPPPPPPQFPPSSELALVFSFIVGAVFVLFN